jgi:hypothetical protein
MFVTTGRIVARTSFADIAKQLESGMAPILQRAPGFAGYYVIQENDKSGVGTAVYASAKDWEAVSDEILAWYEKNISPLTEGDPLVVSGEVIVSIEPAGAPAQAGASPGAEARPH